MTAWPSRAQSLQESGDLPAVCRARELPGCELFSPNEFYGNDRVLKLYAGLPPDRPLKVIVPHGIVLDPSVVWEAERRAPLPAVLAYGERSALVYTRSMRKAVFRSAVPMAYAMRLIGTPSPAQRDGTLAFPGHSTQHLTAEMDFAGMAEALLALETRFQPVTVCIYWRDYELGRHRPFVERGLRVVSAGHINDPAFTFRLAHLLSAHRYATGNQLGSSLFYAAVAGCETFMLAGIPPAAYRGTTQYLRTLAPPDAVSARIADAFAEPAAPSAEHLEVIADLAGLHDVLAPEAMRDCLAAAERLDHLGVASHPQRAGVCFAAPSAYMRAAKSAVRSLQRRLSPSARTTGA
jgi:hypothetical protein